MANLQREIFKARTVKVTATVLDVDGKEIKIDAHDDEEQKIKYNEIINVLVTAGYFRARIKGLLPFDMVVGGMTWCIDTSEIDIDVDLLFEEGLTIGQKIALTEKIVVVLPKIKCPYFIEPHQIQGLDFIHILPVIQWLVKWSTENRRRKAEYLRAYAIRQFHKRYPRCEDSKEIADSRMFSNIQAVQCKYSNNRIFKPTIPSEFIGLDSKLQNVERTLYEYELSSIQTGVSLKTFPESVFNELKKGFVLSNPNVKVKSNVITRIIQSGSENISNLSDEYSKLDLQDNQYAKTKILNEIAKLTDKKKHIEDAIREVLQETEELEKEIKESEIDWNGFSEDDKKKIKILQNLLEEHEELKENETKFKEACKIEMARLQEEIQELEVTEYDKTGIEGIENMIKELEDELKYKKQELGIKTRAVLLKERQLDQIPNRAELSQYQKRFVELYNQISVKHKETKQYYALFNMLTDKCQYLQKEYNLLNSIYDSYNEAFSSSLKNREEFLKQLRGIGAGIQQTKLKVMQKRNDERQVKEKLINEIEYLQDQKRRYTAAVKELSLNCKENEKLISQIHDLSSSMDYAEDRNESSQTTYEESGSTSE